MKQFILSLFILFFNCIVVVNEVKPVKGEKKTVQAEVSSDFEERIFPKLEKIYIQNKRGRVEIIGMETDSISVFFRVHPEIEPDISFKRNGELKIKAKWEEDEGDVEFRVEIPSDVYVLVEQGVGTVVVEGIHSKTEIKEGAGTVELKDISGELSVQTGTGKVIAYFAPPIPEKSSLELGMGEIAVYITEGTDIRIKAGTGFGEIHIDESFEFLEESGFLFTKETVALKGRGENQMNLSCGLGSISVNILE